MNYYWNRVNTGKKQLLIAGKTIWASGLLSTLQHKIKALEETLIIDESKHFAVSSAASDLLIWLQTLRRDT